MIKKECNVDISVIDTKAWKAKGVGLIKFAKQMKWYVLSVSFFTLNGAFANNAAYSAFTALHVK